MTTLRHLALALAWGCSLLGIALMLLYAVPDLQLTIRSLAMAASFIPYGLVLWALAILGFLAGGRRWTKLWAVPALVALIVQVGWARPYWPALPGTPPPASQTTATPPAQTQTLRVLSANVHYGKADPVSAAAAITAADPDVVVLLEASDPFVESPALTAALAALPHRVGRTVPGFAKAGREDASGTLILSRHPLTEVGQLPSLFDQYVVRVAAEGPPLTLVAAHPMNMVTGVGVWQHEGEILREGLAPHLAEPLIAVGDFNATAEHVTLRRLFDLGLTLGAQEAGGGWHPTYPSERDGLPSLIGIDHVLTNDRVTTTSYETVAVRGSDHRAIVADLTYG
ncbi:MAG: endonuclease/exonuclease/phosphatase family protein [Propionibacteriaceae bacterium]|nr:endonuclease/exonuclease/phosphatase family protein [Propionibacteriaceae bacterium]